MSEPQRCVQRPGNGESREPCHAPGWVSGVVEAGRDPPSSSRLVIPEGGGLYPPPSLRSEMHLSPQKPWTSNGRTWVHAASEQDSPRDPVPT